MFVTTFMLLFSLKAEIHNLPADARVLALEKLTGKHHCYYVCQVVLVEKSLQTCK
jgi:hypothetical protein